MCGIGNKCAEVLISPGQRGLDLAGPVGSGVRKSRECADLQRELEALFESQNQSPRKGATSIPASYLRVTVSV